MLSPAVREGFCTSGERWGRRSGGSRLTGGSDAQDAPSGGRHAAKEVGRETRKGEEGGVSCGISCTSYLHWNWLRGSRLSESSWKWMAVARSSPLRPALQRLDGTTSC